MKVSNPIRGDGVGLEITRRLVRGVRLAAVAPGRLDSASEVAIAAPDDERSIVDALIRIRAELGNPTAPTRIATFPIGSTLHRLDVTGNSGTELNRLRAQLAADRSISSTVLVDDGPRRWLVAVRWEHMAVRRLEELAERAGFVDVAADPSPIALGRVLGHDVCRVRRDATSDESFEMLVLHGRTVVAATVHTAGRRPPALTWNAEKFSSTWFDHITTAADLVAEIQRMVAGVSEPGLDLWLGDERYPPFPPHDLRAPERQCVALGAAFGAAGLAGRLRPVDIVASPSATPLNIERPWAIERVSSLPAVPEGTSVGPIKRFIARVLPRRR